jgi:hypothetical protein
MQRNSVGQFTNPEMCLKLTFCIEVMLRSVALADRFWKGRRLVIAGFFVSMAPGSD